ncbi:MAG: tetratricopeptide repeat protein [Alcanivoracaceae bacterium]|nr:tetratricopeptide repeat protein [Alcanivoracaceae bacterium]
MADYTEEEQVEALRRWWAENGTGVIVAVVLAVAAIVGWRHWGNYRETEAANASVVYQSMQDAIEQAQTRPDSEELFKAVRSSAEQLIAEYGNSAYADYARLTLARLSVEEGDYESAAATLQEVIKAPETDTIKWVATLRLARLKIEMKDLDGASALVTTKVPEAFAGQALELKGDIQRARSDVEGARAAYEDAIELMQSDAHKELVRMKLQDLAPAS